MELPLKKFIIFIFLTAFSADTIAQLTPDQLKIDLKKETSPLRRFYLIDSIALWHVRSGLMDDVPIYNKELFKIAEEMNNDSLLMLSQLRASFYLDYRTDTKPELEFLFKALTIAEHKYKSYLARIHITIAAAYEDLPNFDEALKYLQKSRSEIAPSSTLIGSLHFHLARTYSNLGKVDSALHYVQLANEFYVHKSDPQRMKGILTLTANIYDQLGNYRMAEDFYINSNTSIIYSTPSYVDATAGGEYSRFLYNHGEFEKARFYGLKGLNAAIASQAKKPLLNAVSILSKTYDKLHMADSAFYYARLELAYRDSLYNQEKINSLQDMTFTEEIRQKEIAAKEAEQRAERKHNLEYAAIALGLITFVIFFLLLSHSIIANQKLIRFFGIVALLLVFEFINLFIHPYLVNVTNDSPLLMLLVMVCIASLLVSVHHWLEKWITHQLVEKNKKIRLAGVKKTIATLEG